ncbi:permease [Sporosarcina sp. P21c]|uniref:purine-cytosine permease family protein n=1 Tax=Sporosarcina TaxID=1569 RepID=UPI000A156ACA|nr:MULTISPECIES: cytosine permease [Sporosarcina]ARJ38584.1 permease [Sporosarcina ureae]PIC67410.1 permease [Sporosarcina sp. P16a]PIC83230.1 permease [Sporosarcina sp. P1]PIC89666.1 permease [Sporosarcina sp. P21c]PIC92861.1 permease [Sporosarcina sp. P25]
MTTEEERALNTIEEDETEKDYSLDRVPLEDRNKSWLSITNITFGIATAIFYFQMGSVMALQFGAPNAIVSAIYAIIVAGLLGTVIAYLSAKSGMNVNLLSRGGGFGYIGSSLTSLIYASNFIMYCAFEGLILVSAVHYFTPDFPKWILIIIFGTLVIPLNWFGIEQLDKLQKWSMPIFMVFLFTAIILSFIKPAVYTGPVFSYMPEGVQFGGTALLFCIGMHNGIMGLTALLASDYARFLKPSDRKFGSIAIGFIPQIFCYGVMGGLGIWFGVRFLEKDPGVYIVLLLGIGGALFTMLTQLRINVTNIYSSSLSLSNFFENVFRFTPGRRFWVVISAVSAILLMLGGIVDHLDTVMTFQGVFLFSWAAILVTDAVVVKKWLKIGPTYYVARQEYLYKWNPVGVASLLIASTFGSIAAAGYLGIFLQSTAAFIAAILAAVLTVVIALYTKGKYYLVREPNDITADDKLG